MQVNSTIKTWYFSLYRMLGLDLVVRDDQGNILDPLNTSTINLFQQVRTSVLDYDYQHNPNVPFSYIIYLSPPVPMHGGLICIALRL